MHPCVAFYRENGAIVRHSLVFLSDDIAHDHHAVHHYTCLSIRALCAKVPSLTTIYLFSDGCGGQYKGKGTFADLSLYKGMSQLIYYICFLDVPHFST